MFKKAVLIAVLMVALSAGYGFAAQVDSLASSVGPAAPTQVFVNPGGLGDALIYGYYNVRGRDTFFTVTNTDTVNGARVRIRFREADTISSICNGSQELLDFDICLTPGDMWSGMITTDSAGAGRLFSNDKDTYVVVSPAPAPAVIFPTAYPNGAQFKFGSLNPQAGITADMTREGYFEIIAERGLTEVTSGGNCGPNLTDNPLTDVGNVLMGHLYMVDTASSETFGYAATALGDFSIVPLSGAGVDIGSPQPNFRDNSEDATIVPVNYALTKSELTSVYDLQADVAGATQLVVTFPTKLYTHSCASADDIFDDPRVKIIVYDDAENSPTSTCEFSPCPTGTDVSLPDEVNVIDINSSAVFSSTVTTEISTPFSFGWIDVNLVDTNTTAPSPLHQTQFNGGLTSLGLPALGYAAHSFVGGNVSGMIPMQYKSNIQ